MEREEERTEKIQNGKTGGGKKKQSKDIELS